MVELGINNIEGPKPTPMPTEKPNPDQAKIDYYNSFLPKLKSFVLPGGSVINAQFHMARNVCRRAERRAVSLSRNATVEQENIRYLNRLSDLLFVVTRVVNHREGEEEVQW